MLEIMQKAALKAGDILLKYFEKGVSATQKTSHSDLLTEADLESQEVIYQTIKSELNKKGIKNEAIGFIGEEKLNIEGKHTFIIDPLDGTNNFATGYDYFSIAIAYALDGKITQSLAHYPIKKTTYTAILNKGSYKLKNNSKLRLNLKPKKLSDSILTFGLFREEKVREKEINFLRKIFPYLRGLKSNGSIVLDLCHSAENIFSIVVMGSSCIWDLAAAGLILKEAGGEIYDWHGKPIVYDFKDSSKLYKFITCHPKLLHEILKFFD